MGQGAGGAGRGAAHARAPTKRLPSGGEKQATSPVSRAAVPPHPHETTHTLPQVLPCAKRYCHDWATCPYAHPGEKAARRDLRGHIKYTGIACPDMKAGGACARGDVCPYAHSVFEYWLHPTR